MPGSVKTFWAEQRVRPWLDHALRAWQRNGKANGSLLAGALTFFSFLALFPLVLLAVAVAGYILKAHPDELVKLTNKITSQAPGGAGSTLKQAVDQAIGQRARIGVVGLVGVALTGVGWISNLRQATEQMWQHPPLQRNFLLAKVSDGIVLIGLGVGLLLSVALTAVGSELTTTVLKLVDLQTSTVAHLVTKVAAVAVAVLADMIIFGFLLLRLPKAHVHRDLGLRAALLAAVGFEILKVFGTWYIGHVSKSTTYGTLASIIGVLVWLNLVYRFLLYCTAWTAVATPDPLAEGPNGDGRPGATSAAAAVQLPVGTTVRGTAAKEMVLDGPPTRRRSTVITRRADVPGAGLAVAAVALLRRRR